MSGEFQSHLRLRSIKPKNGAAPIRVIYNDVSRSVAAGFRASARYIGERRAPDMGGYAIVVWTMGGSTTAQFFTSSDSGVPAAMVPEMVKTALADHLSSWRDGGSGPDDGA